MDTADCTCSDVNTMTRQMLEGLDPDPCPAHRVDHAESTSAPALNSDALLDNIAASLGETTYTTEL